ncbi:hypothetical protein HIJ77_003320 [Salmonella enterica]|nr:hypothetical protein [Salmonella enterica]EDV2947381.1 hypothetical protein [Salmonella enterica subsp. houtenae]EGY1152361.1 hypothetical protein [Salmonella enterica subsp. enterica]EDW9441316.1 hypothetical protein [Salmonella enterica subsp. houtenae]EEE1918144.1 hypothetical protein [Salmonella enterica subsp. houtenae]
MLQGDHWQSGASENGVIAYKQIAEVLVAALIDERQLTKPLNCWSIVATI